MVSTRVCHKCREYVEEGETFEAQQAVRAFERDHRGHTLGNADIDEVESYTNVSEKYYPRIASDAEE